MTTSTLVIVVRIPQLRARVRSCSSLCARRRILHRVAGEPDTRLSLHERVPPVQGAVNQSAGPLRARTTSRQLSDEYRTAPQADLLWGA